jgi:hypothetical protein
MRHAANARWRNFFTAQQQRFIGAMPGMQWLDLTKIFFCYEDADLGFRLRLWLPEACTCLTLICLHVGSWYYVGRQSDFDLTTGIVIQVRTSSKNMPECFLAISCHTARTRSMSQHCFILPCRGKGGVVLREILDAVAGLPRVWQKSRVQATRKVSLVWNCGKKVWVPKLFFGC